MVKEAMRVVTIFSLLMMVGGVTRADHTKEDAQATTRRLEAILHPPKKAKAKPAAKPAVEATKVAAASAKAAPASANPTPASASAKSTPASASAKSTPASAKSTTVVDPLYAIIVHAMSIPFDEREREAHLRDIPKNAKELDAHLRRLDAALERQHRTR
jgi:hypothetical protein